MTDTAALPGVKSFLTETLARIVGQNISAAQRQAILREFSQEVDKSNKAVSRHDALLLINAVQRGAGAVPVEIRGRPRSATVTDLCVLTPEAGIGSASQPGPASKPTTAIVGPGPLLEVPQERGAVAPPKLHNEKSFEPPPGVLRGGQELAPTTHVNSTIQAPDRSRKRVALATGAPSFLTLDEARQRFLQEYARTWEHPFVRYAKVVGKTFVFVGTMRGSFDPQSDTLHNVHFKLNDQTPKDAGATSSVLEVRDGAVTLWMHSFHLKEGDKLRFWCNVSGDGGRGKDLPDSKVKALIHATGIDITPG